MQPTANPCRVLTGQRVLVVEDEYFIADDIARALRMLGAEVIGPLPTREAALDAFASEERIDVAVLDINLRGEAIYPVADALRKRGVPFVFATGYDPASIPEPYRSVARWDKPFDPSALVAALAALPRSPQAADASAQRARGSSRE
jgi:DNA-binding response OmpR family regulator